MLAIKNLVKNKFRTVLTILGIALAVLSIILLASTGNGLFTTGGRLLEQSSIHLWVTGSPSDIMSQYTGTEESKITEAHRFAEDLRKNKEINMITPMLTEMIYAFKENSEPRAVFGLGIEGSGGTMVSIIQGEGLTSDEHFNKGKYDGRWKKEVLIDNRTAILLGIKVGDTIHMGKTLSEAKEQEFTVIGLTNSLSRFSSNPMVILYLTELQDMTANKYYDSVTMIVLRLKNPDMASEVQTELNQKYPQYPVSTNQEYLKKALKQNSLPLASAASIVVLAVIMGTLLAMNTMLLSLNEKKKEIAILRVIGLSRWSIFKSIGTEGLLISVVGGAAGIFLSIPITGLLNGLIFAYLGFDGLVALQPDYIYIGFSIAIIIGFLTSIIAAVHICRTNPAELLRAGI